MVSRKSALFMLFALLSANIVAACSDDNNSDNNQEKNGSDSDTDADTDTDTDADTDTDTDTDTDSDTDTDVDSDSDTDTDADFTVARSELSYNTEPDPNASTYQSLVANTNAFGFDLFNQFIEKDVNIVFSPLSIAMALGMTYAGTRNNTATEMAEAMRNDLSDEVFHTAGNRLMIDMASRNIAPHELEYAEGEKCLQLSLVNAIWAQRDFSIESSFLDTLAVNYDSGVNLLDFIANPEASRVFINAWVADNTNQKIENLIPEGAISTDTRLVLTNALYFYGSWHKPFDVDGTSEGDFTLPAGDKVSIPMMQQTEYFAYGEGDGYQLIELPYDGEDLAMTIVLPETDRFDEIRGQMGPEWLDTAREALTAHTRVALTLPKFNFLWDTSLKTPLKELGMVDAFEPNAADFTGINPDFPLFISEVIHKAFIGVDEYGTEAAAATAVIIDGWSSVPDSIPFTADRPFFFFIRDTTGIILFAGQILDPSK
jgi:serpin B